MEDAEIVRLYWERDEIAISATADKYGNYCTAIARNILGIHEDAEECVNDTYLYAWNTMPPQKPHILATFLGKITRNLSFNRYKYNTAEKRGGGQLPVVLEELGDCVSGQADVEAAYEYQELVAAINAFLAALSWEKRCIFIRRYWFTDSVEEIAVRFHMNRTAVSMTLTRIRSKLRTYLAERGFDV